MKNIITILDQGRNQDEDDGAWFAEKTRKELDPLFDFLRYEVIQLSNIDPFNFGPEERANLEETIRRLANFVSSGNIPEIK